MQYYTVPQYIWFRVDNDTTYIYHARQKSIYRFNRMMGLILNALEKPVVLPELVAQVRADYPQLLRAQDNIEARFQRVIERLLEKDIIVAASCEQN